MKAIWESPRDQRYISLKLMLLHGGEDLGERILIDERWKGVVQGALEKE